MAIWHVLVERPPEHVWGVLSDPSRYSSWVVGPAETRPADGQWPEPGARLEYTVRLGPLTLAHRTVVRISEPPRRLELEAFAGRLGSARIAIEIVPWGDDSLVVVDEHPLRGVGGAFHSAPMDLMLHLRHRRMLQRLVAEVEGIADPAAKPGAAQSGAGESGAAESRAPTAADARAKGPGPAARGTRRAHRHA